MKTYYFLLVIIFTFSICLVSCKSPDCSMTEDNRYLNNEVIFQFYNTDTSRLIKNGQVVYLWLDKAPLSYNLQDRPPHQECKYTLTYKNKIYYRTLYFKSSDSLLNTLKITIQAGITFNFNNPYSYGYANYLGTKTINGSYYEDLYYSVLKDDLHHPYDSIRVYYSKAYGLVGFYSTNSDSYQR